MKSKTNDVDSSNERHCAFCLQVGDAPAKLCGGCKKRAYCSRECQVADWKITGSGQRHKNWCGRYEHGEEDVDWEVVPIPNKGLGVRAKRLIPAGFRIIVEPVFTDPRSHPGINDLEPKEGSLEAKFKLNSFQGHPKLEGGKPLLGLRSSRVNHNCSPNAGMSCDHVARVQIIFSLRVIPPGEEICICYYTHLGLDMEPDSVVRRRDPPVAVLRSMIQQGRNPREFDFIVNESNLKFNWGIICPDDCFCKNPVKRKLILEAKQLYDQMRESSTVHACVAAGVKMLTIYEELGISWVQKADVLFKLSEMDTSTYVNRKTKRSRRQQYFIDCLKIRRIISPFASMGPVLDQFMKRIDAEDK